MLLDPKSTASPASTYPFSLLAIRVRMRIAEDDRVIVAASDIRNSLYHLSDERVIDRGDHIADRLRLPTDKAPSQSIGGNIPSRGPVVGSATRSWRSPEDYCSTPVRPLGGDTGRPGDIFDRDHQLSAHTCAPLYIRKLLASRLMHTCAYYIPTLPI